MPMSLRPYTRQDLQCNVGALRRLACQAATSWLQVATR